MSEFEITVLVARDPNRTIGNAWDARCKTCLEPINVGYLGVLPPDNRCPNGCGKAHQCSIAMARAHNTALVMKMRERGELK